MAGEPEQQKDPLINSPLHLLPPVAPAAQDPFDEDNGPWDLGDDDKNGPTQGRLPSELEREWQSRQSRFHTLGYRDGIDAGRNSCVQEGFDEGFKEAVTAGCKWGSARGCASAFVALPESAKALLLSEGHTRLQVDALHATLSSISSNDALVMFDRHINRSETIDDSSYRPTNAHDITEDLNENAGSLNCEVVPTASSSSPNWSRLEILCREVAALIESA